MKKIIQLDIEVDDSDPSKCSTNCRFFTRLFYGTHHYIICDLFHKGIEILRHGRLQECMDKTKEA
ncbi:MAG: hypothetical protein ABFD82_18330, partial [Syntrophaceae bacterium]